MSSGLAVSTRPSRVMTATPTGASSAMVSRRSTPAAAGRGDACRIGRACGRGVGAPGRGGPVGGGIRGRGARYGGGARGRRRHAPGVGQGCGEPGGEVVEGHGRAAGAVDAGHAEGGGRVGAQQPQGGGQHVGHGRAAAQPRLDDRPAELLRAGRLERLGAQHAGEPAQDRREPVLDAGRRGPGGHVPRGRLPHRCASRCSAAGSTASCGRSGPAWEGRNTAAGPGGVRPRGALKSPPPVAAAASAPSHVSQCPPRSVIAPPQGVSPIRPPTASQLPVTSAGVVAGLHPYECPRR